MEEIYTVNQIRLDCRRTSIRLECRTRWEPLHQAVEEANHYRISMHRNFANAELQISCGYQRKSLCFGNGASECNPCRLHGKTIGNTSILVPSFLGYEEAAKALDCEVIFVR